jgi:sulfate adenylyltransferase subunit 2
MKKYLKQLESEAIYIIRETYVSFKNPVLLYSVGKDSGVLVRLCQKAFYPTNIPFFLMHIDTGFKFKEMYDFRDKFVNDNNLKLIIHKNQRAILDGCNPHSYGTDACCLNLKTKALLTGINENDFDAAIGGARREEEKSRAKERVFSVRDSNGQWDPKNQKPEPWNLYNTFINKGETVRVFPLSNWTETDVWNYIKEEDIPVVPLYFAQKRKVIEKNGILIPDQNGKEVMCRFRSLGCMPCTGAIRSTATQIDDIIDELRIAKRSERENRVIDLSSDSSMEDKKREGYF